MPDTIVASLPQLPSCRTPYPVTWTPAGNSLNADVLQVVPETSFLILRDVLGYTALTATL